MNFGVDAVRYSFIVMDLHHLLVAGLPAHSGLPPIRDRIADIPDWQLRARLGPRAASELRQFITSKADIAIATTEVRHGPNPKIG